MSDDTVKLIAEARQVLHDDLEKREVAYRAFREKSPMLWKGKDEVNPLQDRLAQIEIQRSALLLRQAELEGQLKTIEWPNSPARATSNWWPWCTIWWPMKPALIRPIPPIRLNRPRTPTTLKSQVLPLLMEDRTLSADYGPNHPQVQAVRQEIEAMHNFVVLPASASVVPAKLRRGRQTRRSPDPVEAYVQYVTQERDRTLIQQETLAKLFQSEHDAARKLNGYEIQDAEFRNGIARTENLYEGLVKRLQEAGLVKDYGGYEARVIAPAGIGKQVSPNLPLILGGSVLLALLSGMGLAFLAETADKRFRTLDELHRWLGLPVMACIPLVASSVAARKKGDGGSVQLDARYVLPAGVNRNRGFSGRTDGPVFQRRRRRPQSGADHKCDVGRREIGGGRQRGGLHRTIGQEDPAH